MRVRTQLSIILDGTGVGLVGQLAAIRDELLLVLVVSDTVPSSVGQPGSQLEIRWADRDFSEYRLKATLVSYVDGKKVAVLRAPEKVTRVQRRTFFRVDTNLDMEFQVVECGNEKEYPSSLKDVWFRGTIVDLSGGGCRLRTATVLPRDCKLVIRLRFDPNLDPYVVPGVVLRSEKDKDHFSYGVAFHSIDPQVQDDIVEHVIQTEAERVKGSSLSG